MPFILGNKYRGRRFISYGSRDILEYGSHLSSLFKETNIDDAERQTATTRRWKPNLSALRTEKFIARVEKDQRDFIVRTLNRGIVYTGHMANRDINPQYD